MFLRVTLLLSSLITLAACGDDGGGSTSDASTGNATTSTTAPSTGDASISTGMASELSTTEPTTTSGSTSSTPTTTEPTGTTDATTGDESSESGSGETSAVEVDYMADIQPIWDMRCVVGCHVASGAAGANGPLLAADESYDELVDAKSKTVPEFVQVKPGDPELSYLWHKVNGTQGNVGGLGSTMPLGGMLSVEDLAKIEAWITAGAKP